ncbi:hypothetical protein BB559_006060, partial [Furculomyces boomerangus]
KEEYFYESFKDYINRVREEEAEKNGTEFERVNEKDYTFKEQCLRDSFEEQRIITPPKDYSFNTDEVECGMWHVEGMENKEIVTTGMYYYDQENITDSYLAFRQSICEPEYDSLYNTSVKIINKLEDDDLMNQHGINKNCEE